MAKAGETTQKEALAVLRRSGKPLSAYDLLAVLRESNPKIAPPTIYRALAALTRRGQVHKVETMNAFVACTHIGHDDASVLSICDDCGSVEERVAPDFLEKLADLVGQSGFASARWVIEARGLCAACNERARA